MSARKYGTALYFIGVFFLFVHTTLPFLWSFFGSSSAYPLASSAGFWSILPGFTPPIGALLMLLGGLLYGKETRRR
jgi:hypothetical protein